MFPRLSEMEMGRIMLGVFVFCVLDAQVTTAKPDKPNFLIMLMDDMGWGDLGCYGNPAHETPNLDRMASEGMLFTDFYSAAGICSPSRASLLTGRLPIRNGFYSTNQFAKNSYLPQEVMGGISHSEVLFPELLQKAGYRNKIIGKWHLGHRAQYLPLEHGFDEWYGAPDCHYHYDDKVMPNIPVYKDKYMVGRYYDDIEIDLDTGLSNLTQTYIQEALEFIEKQAHSGQPFLLYWTPDATHTPLYASPHFRGRSTRGLFGDAVMELDSGVGIILEKLRELGIDNNTFSFFSSDNGAATYAKTDGICPPGGSNGPFLCGKQTTFEGGMREPGIAKWPGKIASGKVSSQVASLMDLFSTVLDLAGVPPPSNVTLDGSSLSPYLFHGVKEDRPVFYYRNDALFKVRYGHYKAHFYTWDTPADAQAIGYHYCPGQHVENVTTVNLTDYRNQPLVFHLGRDPGEKFFLDAGSDEYKHALATILPHVEEHTLHLKPGPPQFDWCDLAVQNWAPAGCEKIDRCMPSPMSHPYHCHWPY